MIRPAPILVRGLLEAAEGREKRAYPDTRGTWTIGVGHTGPEVHPDLFWDDAAIDAQLDKDIAVAIGRLELAVKPAVILSLTDAQYGALISFVFNMGMKKNWKIWVVLNGQKKGWEDAVVVELGRFIHETDAVTGEKRVVPGLLNRRNAESTLFMSANGAAAPAVRLAAAAPIAPSSGSLREEETPPSAPVTPLRKRWSFLSGIGGGALAAPVMINAMLETVLKSWVRPVMEAIAPFADRSAVVGNWVGYLAMAAAAIVAITLALQAFERHQEKTR